MAAPELLVEFTTDDPDDTTPSWTDVTSDVRSFSTNRGRDTELSRVEAGTATVVLNNRSRSYDPTNDATLRPMNRWRISAVMDGPVTEPLFLGYVESYEQQWPAIGKDAVTVVQLVDEFKVLALDRLPTTDPPRDSYQDLALFDEPNGYWPLLGPNIGQAAVGENVNWVNSISYATGSGAILGQTDPGFAMFTGTQHLRTEILQTQQAGDMGGLSEFSVELWFATSGTPSAGENLLKGPTSADSLSTWAIELDTSRNVLFRFRNSSTTLYTATSTTALTTASIAVAQWYHIVGVAEAGEIKLYINGVLEDTTSITGVIENLGNDRFFIGNAGTTVGATTRAFDEVALYTHALTADRVLAHYEAGALRGFRTTHSPHTRIDAVLDAAGSVADRAIQDGTVELTGSYMVGQPALDELRKAEFGENRDAILFIARDGTITFLEDGHRADPPYDTVGATFDDDGTDLPYQDISVDYSDSFLVNEWNVTRTGGTTTIEDDATSIAAYFKRSQSITDLPVTSSTYQDDIAAALLAKYKDPMNRITSLNLLATEEVAEAVFPLDLGYRVRVFRTQPGGGRIDQTLFIQRIAVSGAPGAPWQITLGVSPL